MLPPYLQVGDTIGIVCPASQMPKKNAIACIKMLEGWGFKVKTGYTLGNKYHYFAGTDEERLDDFQKMLDDAEVKAIVCGRGGFGISRIIDAINWNNFKKKPKWIVGFSDVTVLHAHIHQLQKIATLHAPMAGAFNDGGEASQPYLESINAALTGVKTNYEVAPHEFNNSGKAEGILIGGNLTLIAHLIGTRSGYKTANKILFIEDVGEYIYNVDRMMIQLKRSHLLENVAGLIIGGFTEMKDTVIPYGKDVYQVIRQYTRYLNCPVAFGFPVGHQPNNYALKVGINYRLTIQNEKVALQEL